MTPQELPPVIPDAKVPPDDENGNDENGNDENGNDENGNDHEPESHESESHPNPEDPGEHEEESDEEVTQQPIPFQMGITPMAEEGETNDELQTWCEGTEDLEEEDEEDESIPQSWEQRTGASLDMETLISLESEGIAQDDFDKSWARMQDINDVELEKKNPPIDRSKVKTYHLNSDILEGTSREILQETNSRFTCVEDKEAVC